VDNAPPEIPDVNLREYHFLPQGARGGPGKKGALSPIVTGFYPAGSL
jgi:hypothetical protein